MRGTSVLFISVFLVFSTPLAQSSDKPFWPNVMYDPAIPTLESILGHDHGKKITSPAEVLKYVDALAAAAPDRTRLVQYAASWEGRPLVYLVISSQANMAQLDANQQRMQTLVDPRLYDAEQRDALLQQTIPVSWLSYGVHGDEISSTDAALVAMYHLLAAKDDATVTKILADSIVVLDPSQNPDGRARFVHHFEQNLGLEPSVHQLAAEHRQAWPRARTNHYLFDMNRDWFAITQPETLGRVTHYLKFHPVVHADIHEMGVDSSYFFPPPTAPLNPFISSRQIENLDLYGKGNAKAFDNFNFDYFTREIFDAHYPGYGDSWPTFQGAIGMTFEMASARGLVQRKDTGELVSYRDGVHRHFVSSLATMLTTATHGKRLLRDLVDYRADALGYEQHYIFSTGDKSLQRKLANKLTTQGIEVHTVETATRACGKSHPAGSYVVKAGQPAGHLVRTLLDADSPIADDFWQEQERKRDQGISVGLYDVLAWSMPGLYGLDVDICERTLDSLVAYSPDSQTNAAPSRATFAYVIPNETSASVQFLAAALRAGLSVLNIDAAFTLDGKAFARGTLVIKVKDEPQATHDTIIGLAAKFDVEVVAANGSWTSSGVNFGSPQASALRAPQIALVWDEPTNVSAAGNTRFVIERQLGYPVTTIRTPYLSSRDLGYFDVLIVPDGGDYAAVLGESGLANLKTWVDRGGVLITAGAASHLLLEDGLGFLATQLEANIEAEDTEDETGLVAASTIESVDDYNGLLAQGAMKPDFIPGVIVRGDVNHDHWLAAGVGDSINFVLDGSDIYTPLKHGSGTNVVHYAAADQLLHGGYLWQENRDQLAFKPAVMARRVGAGEVIAFTTDPAYRGFMDGLHVMLGNAIFKAPSR
ncbi:MAG: hypothetical protein ACI82A_004230 [Candidatus Azotimanducaceae bacterium]|jgi:hypothetical protein